MVKLFDKIFLSYVAAFIDGEGSVCSIKSGGDKSPQLRISVSNTHKGVLEYIKYHLKGRLIFRKGLLIKYPHKKPIYRLQWTDGKAVELAKVILPFSIVKKSKLKVASLYPYCKTGHRMSLDQKSKLKYCHYMIRKLNAKKIV